MTVRITTINSVTAQITWDPQVDDPGGYIAQAISAGRLEDVLTALGSPDLDGVGPKGLARITQSVAILHKLLERRVRHLVVTLRHQEPQPSWTDLARIVDAPTRSSAQRVYEAGLRQRGLKPTADQDD